MDIEGIIYVAIAVLIELGLPIFLVVLLFKYPTKRSFLVPVVSSTVPFILGYAYTFVGHFLNPTSDSYWAIGAMWEMSFLLFIASLILSVTVSCLLPKKVNLPVRAILGGICGPLIFFGSQFFFLIN